MLAVRLTTAADLQSTVTDVSKLDAWGMTAVRTTRIARTLGGTNVSGQLTAATALAYVTPD